MLLKKHWFTLILDYVLLAVGASIYAMGVSLFVVPHHIGLGGVTGIATIFYELFGIPIGVFVLAINIPLLIVGLFSLGKKFLIKTLFAVLMFTIINDAVMPFFSFVVEDKLLASIFGGILMGLGIGLQYARGGSSGGTDIINRIVQKHFPQMRLGKTVMITNIIIIVISALVFRNIETLLYAFVIIFIQSKMIDMVIYGAEQGKMILVVTKNPDPVSQNIMSRMRRGCTVIDTKGAYSGTENAVLLCAVRKNEFYHLKKIVQKTDPAAFMIVTDASEVVGKGFELENQF